MIQNKIKREVRKMTKIIKNIGGTQRRIDANSIARVLGGEKVGVRIDTKQGPVSLFSLRQYLVERLHSSGGRPSLRGKAKRRNKIPLFDEDWHKLKMIAEYYKKKERINVTPGQIASILVHRDVSKIRIKKVFPTNP